MRRRVAAVAAAAALLAAPAAATAPQADPTSFRDLKLARRFDSALPRAGVVARQTWVRGAQMGEQARGLAAQRAAAQAGAPPVSGPPPLVQRSDCAGETRVRVAGFVSWLRRLPGGDALAAVVAERAVDARC